MSATGQKLSANDQNVCRKLILMAKRKGSLSMKKVIGVSDQKVHWCHWPNVINIQWLKIGAQWLRKKIGAQWWKLVKFNLGVPWEANSIHHIHINKSTMKNINCANFYICHIKCQLSDHQLMNQLANSQSPILLWNNWLLINTLLISIAFNQFCHWIHLDSHEEIVYICRCVPLHTDWLITDFIINLLTGSCNISTWCTFWYVHSKKNKLMINSNINNEFCHVIHLHDWNEILHISMSVPLKTD